MQTFFLLIKNKNNLNAPQSRTTDLINVVIICKQSPYEYSYCYFLFTISSFFFWIYEIIIKKYSVI